MDCPRCIEKLSVARYGGVKVDECLYCEGVWLPERSLVRVLAQCDGSPTLPEIQASFGATHNSGTNRHCPECVTEELTQVFVQNVELDLCKKCGGLFFDEGELKRLLPFLEKSNDGLEVAGGLAVEGAFWVIVQWLRSIV